MRALLAKLLPILTAAFLLTACGSSAKRSPAPSAADLPPPRVTCQPCAAAQCPKVPIDTGTEDTVLPEVVEDWLIQLSGVYHACRACAEEHEACLARHRERGDIR